MVVDGWGAVHEPSAAGKVCREPVGRLPTRRFVADDQPHPSNSWRRRRQLRIIVVFGGRATHVQLAAVTSGT